ncbi:MULTISPECIES: hypothetical protein [Streptomyces]|uniref:Lipoprotein n=2 Tax=Streptomyces rapamycinicus TaxID=1226757 RepID=A0A0A0NTS0_STRRN|nr:hypothetical protein [Streptomyces rapamycinicus]AGP60906.1 hypothetical protein M271_47720 [Streptomyces rapamycinicus NRRL 5491]MBB4787920.1 hypothetical protein [Streptomyces rapamycinicus]RLV72259.1 hypothetical protein D3C57_147070 [Streptomyces rapamycinicus NRRL 5491]UTP36440.1 hypothetical protein LIV37_48470 [Streptomyces rapamycinicus NRRL 5491]
MRRLALALLACSALTLAGCAQDFDRGPDGTVSDKVKDGKKFYLVVDPAKGGEGKKFRVSKYDYHDCNRGSKYPKCVDD